MKTLLLVCLLTIDTVRTPTTIVYVCGSAKAKRYHLQADCKGLSNCKHRIMKMTLAQAQKKGLTLCGWEK